MEQKISLTESVILIVDDDPINAIVIEDLLSGLYQTKTVHSGESALILCDAQPPDLILLDVMMDGMSGLETCKTLKNNSQTQHIPIIFITSICFYIKYEFKMSIIAKKTLVDLNTLLILLFPFALVSGPLIPEIFLFIIVVSFFYFVLSEKKNILF